MSVDSALASRGRLVELVHDGLFPSNLVHFRFHYWVDIRISEFEMFFNVGFVQRENKKQLRFSSLSILGLIFSNLCILYEKLVLKNILIIILFFQKVVRL